MHSMLTFGYLIHVPSTNSNITLGSAFILKKRFNSNIVEYLCNGKEKLHIRHAGFPLSTETV